MVSQSYSVLVHKSILTLVELNEEFVSRVLQLSKANGILRCEVSHRSHHVVLLSVCL